MERSQSSVPRKRKDVINQNIPGSLSGCFNEEKANFECSEMVLADDLIRQLAEAVINLDSDDS